MADICCRHCGRRITLVRYSGRDEWVHQPAGAAFADGQHTYCHLTRATPPGWQASPTTERTPS